MRVADKIAIVTGGAGGIGAECARTLAREGAKVIITDVSDDPGRAVAEEIGGEYFHHDVSSLEAWDEVVESVTEEHGCIDILVHCAGIEGNVKKGGLETTLEDWNKVINVNLTGSFLACKAVVPAMKKKGTGSIILLSSSAAFLGTPSALAYGVSKGGVMQLSHTIAMIGAQDGHSVRCNSLHPGVIKGRMTDNIILEVAQAENTTEEEIEKILVDSIPLGKRGQFVDVANIVLFLASDEASYVTGSEFKVDGGWVVKNAG